MVKVFDWWKRLIGQRPSADQSQVIQFGDLEIVTSGQTAARAETALPGTREIEPILELAPPPINPDLVIFPDPHTKRNYGRAQLPNGA